MSHFLPSIRSLLTGLLLGLGLAAAAHAQSTLLSDTFTYSGGSLVGNGGWTQTSTVSTNPIQVANNAAVLGTSGQDVYDAFSSAFSLASNTPLYVGFDVDVTSAQATGDYFFHLSNPAGTISNFYLRTFVKSVAGGIEFGISPNTTTATYGTTVYSLNTTYHVVVEYSPVTGANNDVTSIFINPTSASATALATATFAASEPSMLAAVNLRQGSSSQAPGLTFDNLIVTTDFNAAIPEPATYAMLAGVVALGGAFIVRRQQRATAQA